MFWRNTYLNDETLQNYLNSEDRTRYTYSESRSYREKPSNTLNEQPKLFRQTIHPRILINSNENIVQNGDCGMSSKINSNLSTPKQKKSLITTNSRVLRSNTSIITSGSNETFVREGNIDEDDIHRGYHIGTLNSNSNNSGPDNEHRGWKKNVGDNNFHLSADEDVESDIDPIDVDKRISFGTNNANVKNAPKKTFNQWFQKNMFGLPNDESDDVQPEFSGAISGDEQYDIASFQNSNTFQKSKTSRVKSKKSSRTQSQVSRSDSMMCSPVAVVSYVLEYVWYIVVSIISVFSRSWRSVTNYSNSPRWYLLPFYLPTALANTAVYSVAYSMDRLFGTTRVRRWLTSSSTTNTQWSFFRLLFQTLWLLLWVAVAFIAMHFLMSSFTSEESNSHVFRDTVSASLDRIAGKDCMELNDCCHNNWEYMSRFAFCLVSLPGRWIISKYNQSKSDEESQVIIKSNISDVNEVIFQIQSRLKSQEELIRKYYSRLSDVEKSSSRIGHSEKYQDEKILQLNKEILAVLSKHGQFQGDVEQLNLLKGTMENVLKNNEESTKENMRLVTADIEKLRQKVDADMKSMQNLIIKSDNSASNNIEITKNIEKLITHIQEDLGKLTIRLNEVNVRTTSLETTSEELMHASSNLKKEMLEEISKEMSAFKREQKVLFDKVNFAMSKMEENLNSASSKSLDDEYMSTLIDSHLLVLEPKIVKHVNSTLWSNVMDRIHHLAESLSYSKNDQGTSSSNYAAQSCNCHPSLCLRRTSCVRMYKIRKMLTDALSFYSADKINRADFALESAGGTIATIRCTETYSDRAATLTIFGIPLLRLTNAPRTIIQPSVNPGECWAMKGNRGSVVVQLSGTVRVNAVSIDHIPKSLSPSGTIDSAIKNFEIKALTELNDSLGESLGNFTYNDESSSVQTFIIKTPVITNLIEMIVHSNYGNAEYTCIYRLRVHGILEK